jgi:integrase
VERDEVVTAARSATGEPAIAQEGLPDGFEELARGDWTSSTWPHPVTPDAPAGGYAIVYGDGYTNWLRRSWYPATIAAGLGRLVQNDATGSRHYAGLGFHDLRRASATSLVAAGVDVKTAQTVLGHSDAPLTLDHYAQVVTEQQRAAADAMGVTFFDGLSRGERGAEPSTSLDPDPPENDGEGL